jgi:hypothetical protein
MPLTRIEAPGVPNACYQWIAIFGITIRAALGKKYAVTSGKKGGFVLCR